MGATKKTRQIHLGSLPLGGGAPVVVQSMTNTDTRDPEATLAQIARLAARGCEAVRLAVPDEAAAKVLPEIRAGTSLPLIADIHFDYRLALAALDAGFEGIRINPGNIGGERPVREVVSAAKANGSVIRVGVNSGSLEKRLLARYGGPTPQAMVESALGHVRLLEDLHFHDLKISLKSSSVLNTLEAYRLLHERTDYPLHIGVTEAGGLLRGTVKSSVGLGLLLHEGIGDTLRVSLTADPAEEVTVAYEILRALGLRKRGPEIISCPTCGRTEIDLFSLARAVENALATSTANITVAVMGCVVNGPGEAREADIGLAGGKDKGIIFKKGQIVRTVRGQEALLNAFLHELDLLLQEEGTKGGKAV
ncbi:MAG: flavodoxin-dependent (E)-4-hydroxy-3-methylbut-2-enyl-diphosphate synthase [Desulfovibrio sp.]|nr:flavodoxin-dependent (E)-4-hydroxy-3-methylbut-2-enyl-diphosphate synthase [Desulfovibrio sp.]